MTHNRKRPACQCCDPGCPSHPGESRCPDPCATTTLYRIDMEDRTGTDMCRACADDAMQSGLFNEAFKGFGKPY